jgi:hypothetical protein
MWTIRRLSSKIYARRLQLLHVCRALVLALAITLLLKATLDIAGACHPSYLHVLHDLSMSPWNMFKNLNTVETAP